MKSKEELNELKQEYETLHTKLQELSGDELKMVTGGTSDLNTNLSFNTEESGILGRGKNGKPVLPL